MKLSLFSVSYAGYWGQEKLSLPEFITKAAKLGFDGVMLAGKRPHLSPLDANAEYIAVAKNALTENAVSCAVIAGYTDFRPAIAAEVPYLEMQIAYVHSLSKFAAALGASVVRVFTAYESSDAASHVVWSGVVRVLQEICDRAADDNITIAVQNHHDIALHTDALLEMLSDVDRPNCRLGFDAWSPALRGEDLYESAKKAAPFTAITTNADYVRFPRFQYEPDIVNYKRVEPDLVRAVKFGTGFIDYPSFFKGLRDGGFDGIANYEMCSPVRGGGTMANLDAHSRQYVGWMRENGYAGNARR